jgi:hypothetical protein
MDNLEHEIVKGGVVDSHRFSMRICIQLFKLNADPDPAFYLNADPDPGHKRLTFHMKNILDASNARIPYVITKTLPKYR